jgi:hypothetical protein
MFLRSSQWQVRYIGKIIAPISKRVALNDSACELVIVSQDRTTKHSVDIYLIGCNARYPEYLIRFLLTEPNPALLNDKPHAAY